LPHLLKDMKRVSSLDAKLLRDDDTPAPDFYALEKSRPLPSLPVRDPVSPLNTLTIDTKKTSVPAAGTTAGKADRLLDSIVSSSTRQESKGSIRFDSLGHLQTPMEQRQQQQQQQQQVQQQQQRPMQPFMHSLRSHSLEPALTGSIESLSRLVQLQQAVINQQRLNHPPMMQFQPPISPMSMLRHSALLPPQSSPGNATSTAIGQLLQYQQHQHQLQQLQIMALQSQHLISMPQQSQILLVPLQPLPSSLLMEPQYPLHDSTRRAGDIIHHSASSLQLQPHDQDQHSSNSSTSSTDSRAQE
jgi:hypothetical protein